MLVLAGLYFVAMRASCLRLCVCECVCQMQKRQGEQKSRNKTKHKTKTDNGQTCWTMRNLCAPSENLLLFMTHPSVLVCAVLYSNSNMDIVQGFGEVYVRVADDMEWEEE